MPETGDDDRTSSQLAGGSEDDWAHLAASTPPPADSRRWRGLRLLGLVVALLVVAGAVASRWNVPYYLITPGQALDVGSLISIPKAHSHHHRGEVVLTDVDLTPLSALGYAYYYLRQRSEIVSSADLTGGQSSSQYSEEGVIDMATARQAAVLVALRQLGYHPRAVPAGVAVYAIQPGVPAAETPSVGEIVTAADGKTEPALAGLEAAVGALVPGSRVALTYHLLGETKAKTASFTVWELRRLRPGAVNDECLKPGGAGSPVLRAGHPQSCLPFAPDPIFRNVDLPFPVALRSGGIIGPSAGLSFTLGLLEKLDGGDLTGGQRVAATGTMSNDGAVGAVGGVAEKTIAVRAVGATVFLVPPSGLKAARANAGGRLKVIAVSSIRQAVAALERLGGRLSARSVR